MPTQAERDRDAKRARNRAKMAKIRIKTATTAKSKGLTTKDIDPFVKKQKDVMTQSRKELATLDKIGAASGPKPTTTTPKTTTTKPVTTTTKPTVTAPTPAPVDTFKAPGGQDFSYADDFVFTTDDTGAVFVNDIEGFKRASKNSPFDFFISKSGKLTDKQGNPIDQFGRSISDENLEVFVDNLTKAQQDEALLDAFTSPQEAFDVLEFLPGFDQPLTTSEAGARLLERNARELKFLEEQNARGEAVDRNRLEQLRQQSAAATAGARAALAQDREGPMSQSAPFAFGTFQETVGRQMQNAQLQFESAQASRQQAEIRLKEAQDLGEEEFIKSAAANLQRAKQEERQAETEARKTAIDGMNAAAKLQDQTSTRTTTVADNISAMGAAAANITFEGLQAMIADTNLTMPEALALREAAILEGQAANTKNELEAQKLMSEAAKLKAEVNAAGKTTSQQEFEFFKTLSQGDQEEFMRLKRSQPNMQFFRDSDTGEIFAGDPTDGSVRRVFGESTRGDVTIVPGDVGIDEASTAGSTNNILTYTELIKGSSENPQGVDFVAKVGTPIFAQIPGTVAAVVTEFSAIVGRDNQMAQNGGFGNQVIVNGADGKQYLYNHLSASNVSVGDEVTVGQQLGATGNTGRVMGKGGEELSTEQLAAGRGGHLDFTVQQGGKTLSLDEAYRLANAEVRTGLSGLGPSFQDAMESIGLQLSPGTRKDFNKAMDRRLEDGNIQGAKELLQTMAITALPAESQNKATGYFQTIGMLDLIREDLAALEESGVNTNIFTGTNEKVRNKIGDTLSGEAATLAIRVQATIQSYRKAMTGAAFNALEGEEYNAMFPSLSKTEEFNLASLDALSSTFDAQLKSVLQLQFGPSAYDVLHDVDLPTIDEDLPQEEAPTYTFDPASAEVSELSSALEAKGIEMDYNQLQEDLDEYDVTLTEYIQLLNDL